MAKQSIAQKLRDAHHAAAEEALATGVTPELFEGDPTFQLLLKDKTKTLAEGEVSV